MLVSGSMLDRKVMAKLLAEMCGYIDHDTVNDYDKVQGFKGKDEDEGYLELSKCVE
jgi:hypothetical protein